MRRAIWWMTTALAVVAVGGSAYAWGRQQQLNGQAMATMVNAQFDGALHNALADMESLRGALASAMLVADPVSFDRHLSDVAKFAYAGENDLSRLPSNISADHNMNEFLHTVDSQVEHWMISNQNPGAASVQQALTSYYNRAGNVISGLERIVNAPRTTASFWTDGRQLAPAARDGLARLEQSLGTMVSDASIHSSATSGKSKVASPILIQSTDAVKRVEAAAGVDKTAEWKAQLHTTGENAPYYVVSGDTKRGSVRAEVSATTGKLISYHLTRPIGVAKYDFAQAATDAQAWLAHQGYHQVVRADAGNTDGIARFAYQPMISGLPVLDSSFNVVVALDNGQVIGFYEQGKLPPTSLPKVTKALPANALRAKLGPKFHMQSERKVIVENPNGNWVQAMAYEGVLGDEPYRVIIDLQTGHELRVDRLG
ncbi:germination protein YpeB [Alicyclobacillus hesperidum]|uniref:Germination protein YpeB n=1 Tax=Alicyclobacillus hesperidum TaxID=89784 RepID=A0AA37X4J4_9BACL|nr:PepSY1/2 domain-containing protein [Alicyclobacillus hesperidum]GLV12638.1 germination protein YpeB [Alicyclobacillus hesperidum]